MYLSRHFEFETFLIDEFRTSKLCCNCDKKLTHARIAQNESNKKLLRCLVRDECERSKSKTRVSEFGCEHSQLGVRMDQTRPVPFCRKVTGMPTTAAFFAVAEKDGQSVDINGVTRRGGQESVNKIISNLLIYLLL